MVDINPNRIVRVFNDDIHKRIVYIAKLTKSPYQHVFNEFMEYIAEGHIVGQFSHHVIIERILKARS